MSEVYTSKLRQNPDHLANAGARRVRVFRPSKRGLPPGGRAEADVPLFPVDDLVAFLFEALVDKPPLYRVQVPGPEDGRPDQAPGAAPGCAHGRARAGPTGHCARGCAHRGSGCGSHGSRLCNVAA